MTDTEINLSDLFNFFEQQMKMSRYFAERGDYVKSLEHLDKAEGYRFVAREQISDSIESQQDVVMCRIKPNDIGGYSLEVYQNGKYISLGNRATHVELENLARMNGFEIEKPKLDADPVIHSRVERYTPARKIKADADSEEEVIVHVC